MDVDCSIVIATREKEVELRRTLTTIFRQKPPFNFEVIVVDDGSPGDTGFVCENFRSYGNLIRYHRLEKEKYGNPAHARNVGYKMARGKVIIAQSDDVIHGEENTIELLTLADNTENFTIALVHNAVVNQECQVTRKLPLFTGPDNPRPLFFLGSLLREHVYEIGGNSEDFTEPGYEDDWFAQCLIHGRGLTPIFRTDITGYHQRHTRACVQVSYAKMKELFECKYKAASEGKAPWQGGPPWDLE